jgi:hypothetical protein
MKVRIHVLGAAALLALTSACGGGDDGDQGGPGAGGEAARGGQAIDLDEVDPCALLSDEELLSFFGEPTGTKEPKGGAFLKGCALDDASGTSYVFVSVMVMPTGDKKQYDFNLSQTKNPVAVTGVGEEAFGYHGDDGASVETRYRGALVNVSVVLYSFTDKLEDPLGVIEKLTVLTRQALARL